jgi:hypothetical protein
MKSENVKQGDTIRYEIYGIERVGVVDRVWPEYVSIQHTPNVRNFIDRGNIKEIVKYGDREIQESNGSKTSKA